MLQSTCCNYSASLWWWDAPVPYCLEEHSCRRCWGTCRCHHTDQRRCCLRPSEGMSSFLHIFTANTKRQNVKLVCCWWNMRSHVLNSPLPYYRERCRCRAVGPAELIRRASSRAGGFICSPVTGSVDTDYIGTWRGRHHNLQQKEKIAVHTVCRL